MYFNANNWHYISRQSKRSTVMALFQTLMIIIKLVSFLCSYVYAPAMQHCRLQNFARTSTTSYWAMNKRVEKQWRRQVKHWVRSAERKVSIFDGHFYFAA